MCVGVPMRVAAVEELTATCVAGDRRETVNLALTGPVPVGSDVLVYLGSAVRTLDPVEARQIADALEAVAAAAEGRPFDHLLADLIDREPTLPEHLRPAPAEATGDS